MPLACRPFGKSRGNVSSASPSAIAGSRVEKSPERRIEHDLALALVRFDHAMRVGCARQRQYALDLRNDFSLRRGFQAVRQIGRRVAGPALDGDALVVEV